MPRLMLSDEFWSKQEKFCFKKRFITSEICVWR